MVYGGERAVARSIGVPQAVTTLKASQLSTVTIEVDKKTKQQSLRAYRQDPLYRDMTKRQAPAFRDIAGVGKVRMENGLLFLHQSEARVHRLCVPDDQPLRTDLIAEAHDGPAAAHAGIRRTQQKLALWYIWPGMENDVKVYVQSCATCVRFKSSSLRKNGRLMPLPIPEECWESVGMDFITGLPVSQGYDAIMVVVDLLNKRAKYAPTHTTATAADTA